MTKKRVNILVEEDLHVKAKVIAVLKGMTLNDYLEKAIEEAVERDKGTLDKMRR